MILVLVVGAVVVGAWPARPGTGTRLGRGRRRRPPFDRRLLAVALAAVLTVVWSPLVGLVVVGLVHVWPRWIARQEARRRRWAVVDAVPEAADLLALSVTGGLTVPLAVRTVAAWVPPPVGTAFGRVSDEVDRGRSTADALADVAEDLGAPARPLVDVLLASERYGVPLGESLDRIAREARLERRRRGEERARRVPVLLLFPLVLCVLPAFGFLTVVPLLVGSLPDLPP